MKQETYARIYRFGVIFAIVNPLLIISFLGVMMWMWYKFSLPQGLPYYFTLTTGYLIVPILVCGIVATIISLLIQKHFFTNMEKEVAKWDKHKNKTLSSYFRFKRRSK